MRYYKLNTFIEKLCFLAFSPVPNYFPCDMISKTVTGRVVSCIMMDDRSSHVNQRNRNAKNYLLHDCSPAIFT